MRFMMLAIFAVLAVTVVLTVFSKSNKGKLAAAQQIIEDAKVNKEVAEAKVKAASIQKEVSTDL